MAMSPAWTTDWISRARARSGCSRRHRSARRRGDRRATTVDPPVSCPRCGSRRTRLVSQFGGTACKASYACNACGEPFELFKAL